MSNSSSLSQQYARVLPKLAKYGKQLYFLPVSRLKFDQGTFLQWIVEQGHFPRLWHIINKSTISQKDFGENLAILVENGVYLIYTSALYDILILYQLTQEQFWNLLEGC
jgi:hypothetical protein